MIILNITQLLYFIEIVSSNFNISLAAEKGHVSQSTMSKSILAFEASENIQLFIRHGKRLVGLTPTGKNFYRDARKIIRAYNQMMSNIHAKQGLTGKITVGIASAVFVSHFSRILPQFQLEHPDIIVHVIRGGAEELQQQQLFGKIDLSYVVAPLRYDSLEKKSLITDSGAVVFNENLIKVSDPITMHELAKLPLILLSPKFTIRDQLDTLFNYENEAANVIMESSSENFILNACRAQPLVTVLPHSILKGYRADDLRAIPLCQLNWELISVVSKKNSDPLVNKVRQLFDEAIMKLD